MGRMLGSRELREVAVDDTAEFFAQLRAALAGEGPALLPRPAGWSGSSDELRGVTVPGDVALVIETSGSTAAPKRVLLTAEGLMAGARATHLRLGGAHAGGEQWLLTLPAHYIAGAQVLVRSIVAGSEPVVASGEHFTPEGFIADAARLTGERRYVSLVPVQLRRLVDAAREDARVGAALARFHGILVGGQATPRELLAEARGLGWPVTTTYGSSETSGGAAYNAKPLPGVRMRQVDGELWVASPSLALGYLGDPERTAEAFVTDEADDRWYRTGDAGTVSGDGPWALGLDVEATGTIAVTGRFDSVIISGGVKVNLDEVTLAASSAGAFDEVVAVAVASREWGERVALIAADSAAGGPTIDSPSGGRSTQDPPSGEEPSPGQPTADAASFGAGVLDAGTDARWQRIHSALAPLGAAARPALTARIPELPRLASGKPNRRALRELVESLARRLEADPT